MISMAATVSAPLRRIAAGLLLCLLSGPVLAEEELPGFLIRTAFTDLIDGHHYLYADIDYGLGDTAMDALENGVPLTFEVMVKVIRQRRWTWDKTELEISQQYQLLYHALTERYLLRDLNTGAQVSYITFRAAAAELGRISDLPVIADEELLEGYPYEVRLRVRLVVEAFPAPMRWVAIIFPRWRLASDWYAWMLRS